MIHKLQGSPFHPSVKSCSSVAKIHCLKKLPAFLAALALFRAVAHAGDVDLARYEYQRLQMGMPFRIVFFARDDDLQARATADAAYARVKEINGIMSDYDEESELSRLSRTAGRGEAVSVSDDLWRVLQRARELSERSGGAFDVTAGPFIQLWRKARRTHVLPDAASLEKAGAAVGWEKVRFRPEGHTVELLAPAMRLDLGGVAKGYAASEALTLLRARGIRSAMAGAGGDLAFGDAPPGTRGWRVELAPIDAPDAPPSGHLLLANAAMATSGDLFQHVEIAGKRYSHIINPHTGIALTDHSLVVVVVRNASLADGLSTTVSVLGPETGLKFIEAVPDAEVRIVRRPGEKVEVVESAGFKKLLE